VEYGGEVEGLREAALEMMRDSIDTGARAAEVILRDVPELRDVGGEIRATMRTVPTAELLNLCDAMVRALPRESITPSVDAVEGTRLMARARIPVTAVLRFYRVSQPIVWKAWGEAVRRALPEDRQQAVHDAGSSFMFAWTDRVADVIVHEYQLERDRLAHATSAARIELVERLLAGATIDTGTARRTLGYQLEGWHIAVVLWTDEGSDVDALLRLERAAARMAGDDRPLLVPAGSRTMWAWMHVFRPVPLDSEISAACGDPGKGLAGFRTSHQQALQARRVSELSSGCGRRTTQFRDVEVQALCTADLERSRAFVRRILGDLAEGGETQARLRETLTTYLGAHWNQRETARQLGLHHNTVIYRLQKAQAALGRTLDDDPLAVALALRLADLVQELPGHP
jgi:hypothetical protein